MVKVVAPARLPMANPRESVPSAVRLTAVPDGVVDTLGVTVSVLGMRWYPSTSRLVVPAVVNASVTPVVPKALKESGVEDA